MRYPSILSLLVVILTSDFYSYTECMFRRTLFKNRLPPATSSDAADASGPISHGYTATETVRDPDLQALGRSSGTDASQAQDHDAIDMHYEQQMQKAFELSKQSYLHHVGSHSNDILDEEEQMALALEQSTNFAKPGDPPPTGFSDEDADLMRAIKESLNPEHLQPFNEDEAKYQALLYQSLTGSKPGVKENPPTAQDKQKGIMMSESSINTSETPPSSSQRNPVASHPLPPSSPGPELEPPPDLPLLEPITDDENDEKEESITKKPEELQREINRVIIEKARLSSKHQELDKYQAYLTEELKKSVKSHSMNEPRTETKAKKIERKSKSMSESTDISKAPIADASTSSSIFKHRPDQNGSPFAHRTPSQKNVSPPDQPKRSSVSSRPHVQENKPLVAYGTGAGFHQPHLKQYFQIPEVDSESRDWGHLPHAQEDFFSQAAYPTSSFHGPVDQYDGGAYRDEPDNHHLPNVQMSVRQTNEVDRPPLSLHEIACYIAFLVFVIHLPNIMCLIVKGRSCS